MKKKKTIKINFKYFTKGFNPKDNYFTHVLKKKYDVAISDHPDYLFYSVYSEFEENGKLSKRGDILRKISPRLYIFIREMYVKLLASKDKKPKTPEGNFVKIFYGSEHVRPNMEKCDWALSSYFEKDINHPRHFRVLPDIISDYPHNELKLPVKKNIDFEKIKKEKTSFCNFIYSQENNARNDFFKRLNKYKQVDAPGRCMNNMPPISHRNPRESRFADNWIRTKLDFIKKYKFTIAFESRAEDGWVTEKLTHPLLVNSIPIYFGNKKVGRDINTKSFINANDFKNVNEVIKHVIKVDNDDELYRQYLEEPIFNNKDSLYIDNEKKVLKILTKIIESKNES